MTTNVYDFNVNLEKMENDAELAVKREAKYWRENDAKLRAVHQKVATYEDFKNIVAASHLKPLNKNENLSQLTQNGRNSRSLHWNNFATDDKNKSMESDYQKKPADCDKNFGSKVDITSLSEPELYDKIHNFYHTNSLNIFHTEIPSDVLLRYCRAIITNSQLTSEDVQINWNILTYIGQNAGRLSITLAFMSSSEKQEIKQSIEALSCNLSDETVSKEQLLGIFDLK